MTARTVYYSSSPEMDTEQSRGSTTTSSRPRQLPGSACEECRRRKLRCDRVQPQCGACIDSGTNCVMRATNPPRGPKKGHLRALRNQIAQLASRLDEQDNLKKTTSSSNRSMSPNESGSDNSMSNDPPPPPPQPAPLALMSPMSNPSDSMQLWSAGPMSTPASSLVAPLSAIDDNYFDLTFTNTMINPADLDMDTTTQTSTDMYLTDLVCNDLDLLYFNRVHPFAPMLQKSRYMAWSKQLGKSKEHTCLQYAMWTLAASLSSQFHFLRKRLYTETRQMLDALELDCGPPSETGHQPLLLERSQAWILLSIYEFTSVEYQRGLVSAGRAFRMVQLTHLYEVDSPNFVPNRPGDWDDLESMRRTFWLAYTLDRFTGINNGPALTFIEQEIRTRLPAPEANFIGGRPITMPFLSEVIAQNTNNSSYPASPGGSTSGGAFSTSPFVESILVATICGRCLAHKQRSSVEQSYSELEVTPDFCRRHRWLDSILTSRIETLSAQTAAYTPTEIPDPTLIFAALVANLNVLVLCEVIESMPLGTEESHSLLLEYNHRSLKAAQEIGSLATTLTQLNHFQMKHHLKSITDKSFDQNHPFTPIPLLSTARFCVAHAGSNDAYNPQLQYIYTALKALANANNMAKNYFQIIGMEMGSGQDLGL
ncbi:hypothetical protein B0H66DRAFT_587751 [Apodospora peruviana]|uniref:Zn(2)-C6 fungal-type domain-containing protein n=1 Tax=Apodospora peruviana TaxID=516989 RepID=A0AAE0IGS4_9PEZI|nr:hypothetical protein B0H66DRAFT_587751 [Apodospora peruviana]